MHAIYLRRTVQQPRYVVGWVIPSGKIRRAATEVHTWCKCDLSMLLSKFPGTILRDNHCGGSVAAFRSGMGGFIVRSATSGTSLRSRSSRTAVSCTAVITAVVSSVVSSVYSPQPPDVVNIRPNT